MIITNPNTSGGFVVVKSLAEARNEWSSFDHVLTIEDVGFENGLRIPASSGTGQTVIQFDDTDTPFGKSRAPMVHEIKDLMLEARRHAKGKLLVHCLQGQSRSAALALGILADRLGPGRDAEAVEILLQGRPTAVCNRLMVRYIDKLLSRKGSLVDAWNAHLSKDDRAAGVMLLRGLAESQPE
jgi:predicted protein tyrosine phosphatase|nr:hypothetical protein [Neorhizobium tomejilense]